MRPGLDAILVTIVIVAGCSNAPTGARDSAVPTTAIGTTTTARATPAPSDVDLLADWPSAPTTVAALETVQLLLPAATIPGATTVTREEAADTSSSLPRYEQTWLSTAGSAALRITTMPGERLSPPPAGAPIRFGQWDTGYREIGAFGTTIVSLGEPSGSVTVWAANLTTSDVAAIAGTLDRKSDGSPGWITRAIPTGLSLAYEAWSAPGGAGRTVRWDGQHQRIAELWTSVGYAAIFADTFGVGSNTTRVDLSGATAFTFQTADVAAVVWSPSPGLIVRFGMTGSVDQALDIARTIREVDRTTWLRSSAVAPSNDGCDSLFC